MPDENILDENIGYYKLDEKEEHHWSSRTPGEKVCKTTNYPKRSGSSFATPEVVRGSIWNIQDRKRATASDGFRGRGVSQGLEGPGVMVAWRERTQFLTNEQIVKTNIRANSF